jgi:pre-mRNA-splicing factor 38A
VYASRYWKERCFALTAESLVDRISDVEAVGFLFGGFSRPTPFLCLVVKLMQIKPDTETLDAYLSLSDGPLTEDAGLRRSDMRYLRAVAAVYCRLSLYRSHELYGRLEPLFKDGRKLAVVHADGRADWWTMDGLVDALLSQQGEPVLGLSLPPIVKRTIFEKRRQLTPYVSWLPSDVIQAAVMNMQPVQAEELEDAEELSVDATNRLRAKLGLAPLD